MYRYSSNPISAFMQGFAVVDQLETNRQQRAFAEEQQSQLRKLWARADEDYEKAKLQEYQQKKLVEFDYELKNLVDGIAAEAQALEANGKQEEADNLRNKWFTANTFTDGEFRGVSLAVQEVVKKMQQRDPSFGEHIALAAGRDPGAGSLVNSKEPVANVMVVPPGASPNGQASVAFELNRKDNKLGPMTINRTDRDNDPIDFIPVDTQLMFKVFGPGFASNDLAAARMLRGMWEGNDRGNPRAVNKPDATAQTTAGGGKEQTAPPPQPTGGVSRVEGESFDTADFDPEFRPESTTEPSAGEKVGQFIRKGAERTKRAVEAPSSIGVVAEAVGGFISDIRKGFNGGETSVASREATKPNDAKEAGSAPATFSSKNVATNPDSAIQAAPEPKDNAVGQKMAQSVTQSARNRRPTIPQLMNAASLAKMGVIDQQSLQRYARTGSWDEPSKKQLVGLGNGQFVIFDPATGGYSVHGTAPADGSGMADIKTWQGYTNLMQDRTNGIFEENKAGQDAFLSSMDEVLRIFGNPMQTEEQITAAAQSGVTRYIQQGASFIQNYDPDTAQNLLQGTGDFWPFSDPELRFTPASIAIGTQAGFEGISNQPDANEYLTQYAWKLGNAMEGIKPGALLANVQNLEAEVKRRVQAAAESGGETDRNKIRREVVKQFILEKLGGG